MSKKTRANAVKRLEAEDVSVCISYGRHPAEAVSKAGHLSIQTSGYSEIDLNKVLPILHDLDETFDLEFLGSVSDEHLQHLSGLKNILMLNLSYGKITDEGMKYLSGLTNLRNLELSRQSITGAGIKIVATMTNLRCLELRDTQVDDSGLEALANLNKLTELDLDRCPVTDTGLEQLKRLKNLESLRLAGTRVPGKGLAVVALFENLKTLSLDTLPIGDADAACLTKLTKLESLSLYQTRIGDQGAEWLSRLPQLCWLTLSNTQISDEALRHLRECWRLINLQLSNTAITGAGLSHLPANLSVLSLCGTQVRPEFLSQLANIKNLHTLWIDATVVNDSVRQVMREIRLGQVPSGSDETAAFQRFNTCPLCDEVITEKDAVFVARPFGLEPDMYRYVETPIHWDCFARWKHRPRFARQYFTANVDAMNHNQHWGIARCDEAVLISVNPSEFVEEIEVLLADTASAFRIRLDDWQDWLDGAWFEDCRHEVEREVLSGLIPSWRVQFPTPEAVVAAAGMAADAIGKKGAFGRKGGLVERIMYEKACEDLAQRAIKKGLKCPDCGNFANDYDYCRVETVSEDGPQSCLVCKTCGAEFGPSNV